MDWLYTGGKISITGDLWSESGMGLFGIYAHALPNSFKMEKVLIGLVACESEARPPCLPLACTLLVHLLSARRVGSVSQI